jgi:hypothetical protein
VFCVLCSVCHNLISNGSLCVQTVFFDDVALEGVLAPMRGFRAPTDTELTCSSTWEVDCREWNLVSEGDGIHMDDLLAIASCNATAVNSFMNGKFGNGKKYGDWLGKDEESVAGKH